MHIFRGHYENGTLQQSAMSIEALLERRGLHVESGFSKDLVDQYLIDNIIQFIIIHTIV
ncbi:hypothetical protein JT359_19160 [Candidatus Poribacteria bacterium]|nr:hypothetical protein [Candidatus Poribacteria bacterium]